MKKIFCSDLFPLLVAVAAGPFFIFPRERWLWVLFIVPLLWLVRGLIGYPLLRRTPLDLALAVLTVWVLAGTLRLRDIGPSMDKLAGLVYGFLMFYAVLTAVRRPGRLKAAVALFLAASAAVAVVGTLGRRESGDMKHPLSSKILSEVPKLDVKIERVKNGINPNPLGGTLLLFIPLGLVLVPQMGKRGKDIVGGKIRRPAIVLIILILAVDLAAVVYTRSFGAWSALVFSLLILGRKWRILKAFFGMVLIAAAAFLWLKIDRPIADTEENMRGALVRSVRSRFPAMAAGVEAVREQSLFGVGLDRFRLREGIDYEMAHAHNQFLHTAAEAGIPGLAAYLAILITAGWMAIRIENSSRPPWTKEAARGLAVGQVGFAVFGLADAIALGAKPGVFFWISLSLIAAIYLFPEAADAEGKIPCS